MDRITITEKAAEHIKKMLSNRGKGVGIRVGVKSAGCSGLSYLLEYADHGNDGDLVFKEHGVSVITDKNSMVYLHGMEVDYVRDGLNEGFKFNNPNVTNQCGCGSSFNVKQTV